MRLVTASTAPLTSGAPGPHHQRASLGPSSGVSGVAHPRRPTTASPQAWPGARCRGRFCRRAVSVQAHPGLGSFRITNGLPHVAGLPGATVKPATSRSTPPERVFGVIRVSLGFHRFLPRGRPAGASLNSTPVCSAYNQGPPVTSKFCNRPVSGRARPLAPERIVTISCSVPR